MASTTAAVAADDDEGYIKTASHNYISRQAIIHGPQHVEMKGRSIVETNVVMHGELAPIRIGRYCRIASGTILEPAPLPFAAKLISTTPSSAPTHVPILIGGQSHVGSNCHIQAAAIGSYVWIGDNCKIGKRCIIKDACFVEDGSVLGDDTVVPPFSRVAGVPAHVDMEELPPATTLELQDLALEYYQEFCRLQATKVSTSN
jgi:dynactin-5